MGFVARHSVAMIPPYQKVSNGRKVSTAYGPNITHCVA